METLMTRTSTCIFALLTVLATTSAVNAARYSHEAVSSAGQPQIVVSYSDLDLSRPAGAAAMLSRLHYAARTVCDRLFDERDISTVWLYRDCNKRALEHAVAAVNSPLVARLYGVPGVNTNDALGLIAIK